MIGVPRTFNITVIQWITPYDFNVYSDDTSYNFNALNATRYTYIDGQLPGSVVLNEDGTLTGTFTPGNYTFTVTGIS